MPAAPRCWCPAAIWRRCPATPACLSCWCSSRRRATCAAGPASREVVRRRRTEESLMRAAAGRLPHMAPPAGQRAPPPGFGSGWGALASAWAGPGWPRGWAGRSHTHAGGRQILLCRRAGAWPFGCRWCSPAAARAGSARKTTRSTRWGASPAARGVVGLLPPRNVPPCAAVACRRRHACPTRRWGASRRPLSPPRPLPRAGPGAGLVDRAILASRC
jgi:hypothetical protein